MATAKKDLDFIDRAILLLRCTSANLPNAPCPPFPNGRKSEDDRRVPLLTRLKPHLNNSTTSSSMHISNYRIVFKAAAAATQPRMPTKGRRVLLNSHRCFANSSDNFKGSCNNSSRQDGASNCIGSTQMGHGTIAARGGYSFITPVLINNSYHRRLHTYNNNCNSKRVWEEATMMKRCRKHQRQYVKT